MESATTGLPAATARATGKRNGVIGEQTSNGMSRSSPTGFCGRGDLPVRRPVVAHDGGVTIPMV